MTNASSLKITAAYFAPDQFQNFFNNACKKRSRKDYAENLHFLCMISQSLIVVDTFPKKLNFFIRELCISQIKMLIKSFQPANEVENISSTCTVAIVFTVQCIRIKNPPSFYSTL